MTSWKAEVIADDSGKWVANALRFKSKTEAQAYLADLYSRWTAVRQTRAKRCGDAVTHIWDDSQWRARTIEDADRVWPTVRHLPEGN